MVGLDVLIFDVDGTLADTERDGHRVAFNRAFSAAGLDWDWTAPVYGELLSVTGGKERIRHYIEHYRPHFDVPGVLDDTIAELHATKTRFYTQMLAEAAIPLRPGIGRIIAEARAEGLKLAIATTTTPANVVALLQNSLAADSPGWFEVIAAGDIVSAKKPAPDIYTWAMDKMGVAPEACLALEDSENGVRSAYDAGIRAIVVTKNDFTKDQDFSDAACVLDHLGEPGLPCQAGACDAKVRGLVDLRTLRSIHHSVA